MAQSQQNEQPFFIWANFQDPHNLCMVPEPWASMYDADEIPTFGFKLGEPECFAQKPPFYSELLEQSGSYACHPSDELLPGTGNISHLDWNQRHIQENAACYYGMVSLMDFHIGRIMDALEASGQLENTIIVFASDRGNYLGDHGLWWKSLVAYKESIRVPMIAHWPQHIPADSRSRAFQSLVDLFPTFCDLAGASIPIACEGVSQREVWTGEIEAIRSDVVIEERPYDTDWSQRILITDTHKIVFYANRGYGELYDVIADPNHIDNLWDCAEHASIKTNLLMRLLSHEANKTSPSLGPSATRARLRAVT